MTTHHSLLQRLHSRIGRSPAFAAAAVIFLAAPQTNKTMNNTTSDAVLTCVNPPPKLARAQLGMTAHELADAFESRSLSPADLDMLLGHPEAKLLATAAILRCLGSTKYYFDKTAGRMVHTPDYATQLAAAKLIFERTEGLPVTMNLNVNHNASSAKDREIDPAKMSPAMIEAMERMIARARKKAAPTS